jgi:ABC-2 type transport system ATP-binding protein
MRPVAVGARIVVSGLTKRYGALVAVEDLSFTAEPGRVTGFLGPNGAGKTTTLRMILGLITPSSGIATIAGKPYAGLADPLLTVGAALEATGAHPGRSGRNHLRILAATAGIPDHRIDEVLDLTGLATAARRPVGGYSLGMRQRLALAAALVGDPRVLVLDEPANGLDPEGIRWLRELLADLAGQGRTVLVSSHLLTEMAVIADDLVIIAAGTLVGRGTLDELVDAAAPDVAPGPGAAQGDLEEVFLRLTRGREDRS